MNRVFLDTSFYSIFMRGDAQAKTAIQTADKIYLNPIVLGKLLSGFGRGKKEEKNRQELEEFLQSPRVNILSIDEETSERYAVILNALRRKGAPVPTNDIWIAASAMQYGLKLLTADEHCLKVSQVIVEIFDTEANAPNEQTKG